MDSLAACVICGDVSIDVEMALIAYRDGNPFGHGPRCRDRDACHRRVLDLGDDWPVDDGRPVHPAPRAPAAPATPAKETAVTWFD